MAWIKLDDHFTSHPKILKAGKHALVLQVRAFCYAGQHLTDGFIPKEQLAHMTHDLHPKDRDWGEYMVAKELWDRHRWGWKIHDFLEYNPSRAYLTGLITRRQIAGKLGAEKRWHSDPADSSPAPKHEIRNQKHSNMLIAPAITPATMGNPESSLYSDSSSPSGSSHVQALEEKEKEKKKNTHSEEKKKKKIEPHARPAQTTIPTRALVEVCPSRFDEFWKALPARNGKKVGKRATLAFFQKLSEHEQHQAVVAAQHYAQSDLVQRGMGIKDPERFLRTGKGDEPWRDWLEPEQPHPKRETVMQRVLKSAMGFDRDEKGNPR